MKTKKLSEEVKLGQKKTICVANQKRGISPASKFTNTTQNK